MGSTPLTENTGQRLLAYAAERLGKGEVAARLNVSVDTVDAWMTGVIAIPNRKLLALADLIDEIDKGK